MSEQHEHNWVPVPPRTRAGSMLMKCAEDGCDEIAYDIQEKQ